MEYTHNMKPEIYHVRFLSSPVTRGKIYSITQVIWILIKFIPNFNYIYKSVEFFLKVHNPVLDKLQGTNTLKLVPWIRYYDWE